MNTLNKFLSYLYLSLKVIFISLGSLFICLIIIFLVNYNSWYKIVINSVEAKNNLELSLQLLIESDLDSAEDKANLAISNLEESINSLNKIKKTNPIFKINFLAKEINSLENVLESANLLSSSFIQIISLTEQLNDNISIFNRETALSLADKQKLLEMMYYFEADLIGTKANLNLVLLRLKNTNSYFFDLAFENNLREIIYQLEQIEIIFSRSLPILRLIPTLGGWPEASRFLILFQNNDELRPTGGFIGSLATLEVSNLGESINMETSDVYHYDMPSIEHLNTTPPEPIAKYMGLKNWYLRDANWSPDWPSSASIIEELFYQEAFYANKEFNNLDGIFAITPQFVAELINLTGSIELNGDIYTAENLQTLLQYQTSVAYIEEDIASWDRKDIISDLSTILKERLKTMETKKIMDLIKIIDQAIIRKDLLLYFTNPKNQVIAEKLNSDGRVINVDHDYLMIVDANLAAFKTDAVITKDWFYQIEELNNNMVVNLYLNYKHEGGFDWRTTRYRSYTRILGPMGSQLLSIENASDIKVEDDEKLNKTIFGFFLSIEPKETKQIKISYQLPDKIKEQINNDNYQLYLQRQAGSRINSFRVQLLKHPPLTNNLESDKLIRISQ